MPSHSWDFTATSLIAISSPASPQRTRPYSQPPTQGLHLAAGSWKKQESSRKTSTSALLTMPKLLTALSFICAAPGTEGLNLKEGVGPLGGEAWLVLATEDPVGQWELDLGVLRQEEAGKEGWRWWKALNLVSQGPLRCGHPPLGSCVKPAALLHLPRLGELPDHSGVPREPPQPSPPCRLRTTVLRT